MHGLLSGFIESPCRAVEKGIRTNCKIQVLRVGAHLFVDHALDDPQQNTMLIVDRPAAAAWADRRGELEEIVAALL